MNLRKAHQMLKGRGQATSIPTHCYIGLSGENRRIGTPAGRPPHPGRGQAIAPTMPTQRLARLVLGWGGRPEKIAHRSHYMLSELFGINGVMRSGWAVIANGSDGTAGGQPCHAERSEASRHPTRQTLRFAQGDKRGKQL